jgi:hypothetical protein
MSTITMERQSPDAGFREADYLRNNPDVAQAVRQGQFASGWDHFQRYGRLEGRTHVDSTGMSREDKVLYGLDRNGLGLEIGPSHNPIAPKRKGFNVHVLDHLDAAQLREKYARHGELGVNIDNIEEVDFVWSGLSLGETVGARACYDWVIASHVIEHVPDLVSFLQQCESLLKPDGRLSLVIPDKRYCFDCLNGVTSTGELLDAYAEKRTRPSPGKVFDHIAGASRRGTAVAWSREAQGDLDLIHPFAQARDMWNRASTAPGYIDVHCWRFTPASFHLLLSDLRGLGLTGLGVFSVFPPAGCEFYVTLGKVPEGESRDLDRLALLKTIQEER